MAVNTVVIAISVVLGIAVVLGLAVLAGLYLSKRRTRENTAQSRIFDPSRMEAGATDAPFKHGRNSSDSSDSTWKEPLMQRPEPEYGYSYEKEMEGAEQNRASWGSDQTYTNRYTSVPASTEDVPMMRARPHETDGELTPKAHSPPSLPPIDTSTETIHRSEPPRSAAVLDVAQSGVSPTRTADSVSIYSLPSAHHSVHDLQRNASVVHPVPPLPRGFKPNQPQYSLDSEPSPLTRGNTRNVAQLLKSRARQSGEIRRPTADSDLARSGTKVSRIERLDSIDSVDTPFTNMPRSRH